MTLLRISQRERLTEDIWQLTLDGDYNYAGTQPGQFINVLIGAGNVHMLRRPISVADVDEKKRQLVIVFRVVGAGTDWLSRQMVGRQLDVLGPLGNGFPITEEASGVTAVVGGGVGIPPLYETAKQLVALKRSLHIFLGFRRREDAFWIERFKQFGQVFTATEDGSLGQQGTVIDAMDAVGGKHTALYACGPRPMLRALQQRFQGTGITGYVSLEERMACGVGACYGCTCTATDEKDSKRVCADGPVFGLEEVVL